MVKVIIGGDLVPTESNFQQFSSGCIEDLIDSKILKQWRQADFRVFNLETPISDTLSPIPKCGPNLSAPSNTIKGVKNLNPSLICLSNNHIMDQGDAGFFNTLKLLDENNLPHVGAGENISNASKPYVFTKDGISVGVYCCAEHEFSIAEENKAGANPFDALESLDHVSKLKEKVDYVIVLYHGGREHYRYPSPNLQKVCRKLVDKGADVVICQHSHCIGCKEIYKNSEIIYGQGNFIFDLLDDENWKTSLLVEVNIKKDGCSCSYIPIVKSGNGIKSPSLSDHNKILEDFEKRSNEILNKDFILDNYKKEAERAFVNYLEAFRVKNRYAMQNYLNCEAHREIFLNALENANFPISFVDKPKKKLFGKVKHPNGRRRVYFFGIKIFSYKK